MQPRAKFTNLIKLKQVPVQPPDVNNRNGILWLPFQNGNIQHEVDGSSLRWYAKRDSFECYLECCGSLTNHNNLLFSRRFTNKFGFHK